MPNDPQNPFSVSTPEDLLAVDMHQLFVNVFSDFYHIPNPGHTFLDGPRGSGKSMMFRYLEPDCQMLGQKKPLSALPFFAVYVAVKATDLNRTELNRLIGTHGEVLINEHFMVVHALIQIIASMRKALSEKLDSGQCRALRDCISADLQEILKVGGWNGPFLNLAITANVDECLGSLDGVLRAIKASLENYFKKISFSSAPIAYKGPLFSYLSVLVPIVRYLRKLSFMPKGPTFLLVDDADNLTEIQTRILNTWVSTRTSADISIKISTQLQYKTWRTVADLTISSPHDYSAINISSVYTSTGSKYRQRMEEIVKRRLQKYQINASPEDFFPVDEKQEARIKEIEDSYRAQAPGESRGYRPGDDAIRYARPDYIKSLKGTRKQGSKYRYAGFDQLVHISSGIVRQFLHPASMMFAEQRSRNNGKSIQRIEPHVQDEVIREQAAAFLYTEFDQIMEDAKKRRPKEELDKFRMLRNLILALGGAFHQILISDASERRVFSVAISDGDDPDVLEIFRLGSEYGYFHQKTLGNKEGTGRTRLFILSRRLAPFFLLDPTSYAGYQFATNAALRQAMENPQAFIRKIKGKRGMGGNIEDDPQQVLDFGRD